MRDKHISIQEDTALFKMLHREVFASIDFNAPYYYRLLWAKLIFYVALSIAFYMLLFILENPYLFVGSYVAYGFSSLLLAFNFAHDLSHHTIFKSKKLNDFFFIFIYTIIGAHAEAWQKRHVNSHHFAPNVEDYDSDLKITSLIRVTPTAKRLWFHRFQHIYAPIAYTTYSLFWIFIKDFVILFSKDEYTAHKGFQYHVSFWFQKVFYMTYLLALPLLFSPHSWEVVLIGFLLMHLSQSLFLLFTFFMTHHVENTAYPSTNQEGYINTSWLMNQIKSSNDMHPFSEVANFILGGFNNHIAHHLFPSIHHIHYPQVNRILYKELAKHQIIPNQTTYWGGVLSHLRLLKRNGRG